LGIEYAPVVFMALEIAASYANNIIKYAEQYQQFLCSLNAGNECTLGTEKVTFMKIENNFARVRMYNTEFYGMHEQTKSERRIRET